MVFTLDFPSVQAQSVNSQDWRELESTALRLLQNKQDQEAQVLYQQAEELFLQCYPQIKRDQFLFDLLDWPDYIRFNGDLQRANFTKLRAIRHLYKGGIAKGRLGKYLVARHQISSALDFFSCKLTKESPKNFFYLGYIKLLKLLIELAKNKPEQLKSTSLTLANLKLQLKLIQENLKLKQQSDNLSQEYFFPEYEAQYKTQLQLLNQTIATELFKLKSLKPLQHPKVGQVSSDGAVIAGHEGWFYICSGSNQLMEYHVGLHKLSQLEINQWHDLLTNRISWHQKQGINYQHIFVPNKISVYPEYYPSELKIIDKRPILQLQQQLGALFDYPLDLFRRFKDTYRLYEQQDCHWSFWGCYLAYLQTCQALGITPNRKLLEYPIEISSKKGDLGDKFHLQELTLTSNLKFNSQVVYDNQLIKYCHQGSIRILKNPEIASGKLIIFGDSFANPGFPNYKNRKRLNARLTSLFAETLREVHFVWTPWLDYDYIQRERPDFVLTEMAERFLIRVPDDHGHLPLEEFAAKKLNKFRS